MSVTFSLPSNETAYPACPTCGGRINYQPQPDRDCKDPVCEGYGPEAVDSTPSLNVTNVNAYALLRVLGLSGELELYGSFESEDLKLRLSMASYRVHGETRPTVQRRNSISGGLTVERLTRYCEVLSTLAELASRRRESISYG